MNILIKFPSRGRLDKFKFSLNRYIEKKSNNHNISFICSFDKDDEEMNSAEAKEYLEQHKNCLQYFYGDHNNKIEAINSDISADLIFDILILAADDLYPLRDSYDERIVSDMKLYHPDMDGCLHYMNPSWEERLDIGCVMTKLYYSRFNYIYHPSYKSIYCDNEYMNVSKILNKHKYIDSQIFEHNYVVSDPTASRNWPFNGADEANYRHRESLNFLIGNNDNN